MQENGKGVKAKRQPLGSVCPNFARELSRIGPH